jgi:hypothetical protein
MMWTTLQRLVLLLTIPAFLGGMTLQLMPAKAASLATSADDCARMTMAPDVGGRTPCKGMDPECVKQMGCLGTPSLPVRIAADFVSFAYGKIAYSTQAAWRDGRSIKPDLFPPIGL